MGNLLSQRRARVGGRCGCVLPLQTGLEDWSMEETSALQANNKLMNDPFASFYSPYCSNICFTRNVSK